jgi:hypothetical protein
LVVGRDCVMQTQYKVRKEGGREEEVEGGT